MAEPQYRWPPGLEDFIKNRDRRCMIPQAECPHDCNGRPETLDHIVEVGRGGAWFDPGNLRAACKKGNAARGAAYAATLRTPPTAPPTRNW